MNRVDIGAAMLLMAGLIVPAIYSASFGSIPITSAFNTKYECHNMSLSQYAAYKVAECRLSQG